MRRKLRRNKKGISTIIATIIIVAIAIVMAIAVAYWALGIGGSFTRFEKLQITSAYATGDTNATVSVKNTGTAAATLDASTVFVNGKPLDALSVYLNQTVTGGTPATLTLQPGDTATLTLKLPTEVQISGLTVSLMIQSSAGNQYPQVVVLP